VQLRAEEACLLIERYKQAGFVVYELSCEEPTAESIERLAATLNLGDAFIPPMYRGTTASKTYTLTGINCLSTQGNMEILANHPAFQAPNAQRLHADGTLQPIGWIKTSILLCVIPAMEGGDSIIFNSVAAFVALAQKNPSAARALMTNCLRRTQNYGEDRATHLGPAFSLNAGEIISRYSLTLTDSWDPETEELRDEIEYACRFMDELAQPESGFWLQFRLESRQGVIMANDKISHGRTSFRDGPGSNRKMFRGLYTRRPRWNAKHE
jgi:Taurine catabolism dioxygenase TauD, TfdA family